jgi:hypothetical protein
MTVHGPTNVRPHPAAAGQVHPLAVEWLWLLGGLALAFAVPFLFADRIPVQRDGYYALYGAAVFALFASWLRAHVGIRRGLTRNWRRGAGLGLVFGALLRPRRAARGSTPHPDALAFAGAILWRGIVYGAADGVLLGASTASCRACSRPGNERSPSGSCSAI